MATADTTDFKQSNCSLRKPLISRKYPPNTRNPSSLPYIISACAYWLFAGGKKPPSAKKSLLGIYLQILQHKAPWIEQQEPFYRLIVDKQSIYTQMSLSLQSLFCEIFIIVETQLSHSNPNRRSPLTRLDRQSSRSSINASFVCGYVPSILQFNPVKTINSGRNSQVWLICDILKIFFLPVEDLVLWQRVALICEAKR